MSVQIQVPLPPYIVKDPRDYTQYRQYNRARFLISLGAFRRISESIDKTLLHVSNINVWMPGVYTDPIVWE